MSLASFVASQRTDHRVPHAVACEALDVSESWFYKWRDRTPTAAQQRRAELDAAVEAVFEDPGGNPGTYGSPRVRAELREQVAGDGEDGGGQHGSPNPAARPKKRFRCLTRPDKRAVPSPTAVPVRPRTRRLTVMTTVSKQ